MLAAVSSRRERLLSPRLSQNRTCGPRIRLFGLMCQKANASCSDAFARLSSVQRVLSEVIRAVNQDGG